MKIAHLNIRSIFTGFDHFSHIVQENDFDVVVITETWLNNGVDSAHVSLPGYNFFRRDRVGRGGGVAAYVKSFYNCSEITFNLLVNDQLEFLFLKLRVSKTNLGIGVFYRPPQTNLNHFLNDFDNILSTVCTIVDELICLGDFNVNFLNFNNPISVCFESYNLIQLINEPTRITGRTSTLLDPIFVSNNELVNSFGTFSVENLSDHNMVFCDLKLDEVRIKPKFVTYRCFKEFDYNLFLYDLLNLSWFDIVREHNIDRKIELLNNFVISLFDLHAPVRTVRVTKPKAPWLTPNLKLIMKERDKAKQKFNRSKTDIDWLRYKELRNYTVSMMRREKSGYISFVNSENNLRKTWTTLKNLNICPNSNKDIPTELSDSNEINNYFATFFQNNSNNCDEKVNFYNSNIFKQDINFIFTPTSVEEVNKILGELQSNAYGVDNISLRMLKYCSPHIIQFIVHIINSCIEQNYFPNEWKVAIGRPLPKKPNPSTFSDLRIISILPTLSKIFEKILYNQIYQYCEILNLIPNSQSGFRKGYSTATAIANLMDDLFTSYDKGLVSVLVLLDFSKAFDTISHRLLCAKLKYYGFENSSLNLVISYLSNRWQTVCHNNTFSAKLEIFSGVPQGSILGPLFFIIYTADILRSIKTCEVQAYADDTQIYYSFSSNDYAQACDILNSELDNVKSLSIEHNLKLNSDKSSLMLFGNKNNTQFLKDNLNIHIDGTRLQIVDICKNLGIVIDSNLRFREHVKSLIQKSFSSLKILYSSRHLLNFKLKVMLCESLVLSQFNYCDFIYGPCIDSFDKNRVQKVQNSCCRFIYGLRKYDHISSKINDINWLTMENRRAHHLGNFVHTLLTSENPPCNLRRKFLTRSNIHAVDIRFKDKLTVPRHRSAMFKRSFIYNAIQLYNSTPKEFKMFNINKFKYKFKLHLLNKQK